MARGRRGKDEPMGVWELLEHTDTDEAQTLPLRGHPELTGEVLGDLDLRHHAHLDQHVSQPVPGLALLRESLRNLFAGDQPFPKEQVAQPVGPRNGDGH